MSLQTYRCFRFCNPGKFKFLKWKFNDISKCDGNNRSTLNIKISSETDDLCRVLGCFKFFDIKLTSIQSRWDYFEDYVHYTIDVPLDDKNWKFQRLLKHLNHSCVSVDVLDSDHVIWFPKNIDDIDSTAGHVLSGGAQLDSNHPGFTDKAYKERRMEIAHMADKFSTTCEPEIVEYNDSETKNWTTVWNEIVPILTKHACSNYLDNFRLLQKDNLYSEDTIPQMRDINLFLWNKTGFQLRPVSGLLSSRFFLHGLAFKVFFCTQYMRHQSQPFFTPEPDIIHEFIGHVPLFADTTFSDFSQRLGLASIGASDEQIELLAKCYWHSLEMGILRDGSDLKFYGASLMSSIGEMDWALSGKPTLLKWNPFEAAVQEFPIQEHQPVYFVAESLDDVLQSMDPFFESLSKPFSCRWNDENRTIEVDRNVKRLDKVVHEQLYPA